MVSYEKNMRPRHYYSSWWTTMLTLTSFACGFGSAFVWLWPSIACTHEKLQPSTVEHRCTVSPTTSLRILPLGDSITAGWGSRVGNGYRKDLLDKLQGGCDRQVQYIGSMVNGDFQNNQMEGWPGYTIESIANQTQPALYSSLSKRPNVVLLHAGTNDMADVHWLSYGEAPQRLGRLIDDVLDACGDATVIVAQIAQCNETGTRRSARIPAFNAAIPEQVAIRADKGSKVMVVDMSSIGTTDADLKDGLHPNEKGYSKMAVKWFDALQEASNKNWITAPRELGSVSDTANSHGRIMKRR